MYVIMNAQYQYLLLKGVGKHVETCMLTTLRKCVKPAPCIGLALHTMVLTLCPAVEHTDADKN